MARIPTTTATITLEVGQIILADYLGQMGAGQMQRFPDIARAALEEFTGYGLIRPQIAEAIMDLSDAEITQERIRDLVFSLARARDLAHRAEETNRPVTEPGQP